MDLNVANIIVESDEEGYPYIATLEDLNALCRLCGNCSEQLLSIFEAEGLEHTLIEKIREHLPLLQVNENDDLPLNICYQCASTLISWHELYYSSIDVEKRLKEIGNKIRSNKHSDNSLVEVDIVIDDQNKFDIDAVMEHTDTLVHDMLSESPCVITESVEVPDDGSNVLPVNIESSSLTAEVSLKLESLSSEPERCSSINTNSSKQNSRNRQRSRSLSPQNPLPKTMNTRHNAQLECKNCFRKFSNKIILSIHNNEARVIQANPSIFSLYQLAAMRHTGTPANGYDLESFECDHCQETFDNKFWLRTHILYLHTDDNKFKCDYCDRRCLTECDLAMHRSVHTLDQKLVCRSCGERNKRSCLPYENDISLGLCACTSLTLDKLNDNIIRKSKNLLLKRQRRNRIGRVFCKQEPAGDDETLINYNIMDDKERKPKTVCENCNKDCGSPYNLKKHKRVHGKRIECKVCGKLYFKTYLRLHMQIHAQVKAFVCDKCGKRFAQSSSLRAHKLIEDNVRKLMCNICGMQFILSSRLQSHLKTHMDNKPFKCQDCDREYGYIWQLRQHRVKHSNVREFTCESCAKSYKTMKHLRQHWHHYPTHRQVG